MAAIDDGQLVHCRKYGIFYVQMIKICKTAKCRAQFGGSPCSGMTPLVISSQISNLDTILASRGWEHAFSIAYLIRPSGARTRLPNHRKTTRTAIVAATSTSIPARAGTTTRIAMHIRHI